MDLVITWPGAMTRELIDVTIRCPLAVRYARADADPDQTAGCAVKEKARRYGKEVMTLPLMSFGRLGEDGAQHR